MLLSLSIHESFVHSIDITSLASLILIIIDTDVGDGDSEQLSNPTPSTIQPHQLLITQDISTNIQSTFQNALFLKEHDKIADISARKEYHIC